MEFRKWSVAVVLGYRALKPEGLYLSPLYYPFGMEGGNVLMFVQVGGREVIYEDVKGLARGFKDGG